MGFARLPILRLPHKLWAEIDVDCDYLKTSGLHADLSITNPPVSLALDFLRKSLAECETVIYLLRPNFLGSIKRRDLWNAH